MVTISIRGKEYKLRFVDWIDKDGTRGTCDNPNLESPEIRVLDSLEGEEYIEVLLHEILHAALWDISEESVYETAVDAARIIQNIVIEGKE